MAAVLLPPAEPPERYERHVWHSAFGVVLIEVIGDLEYVNGAPVEPVWGSEPLRPTPSRAGFEVSGSAPSRAAG